MYKISDYRHSFIDFRMSLLLLIVSIYLSLAASKFECLLTNERERFLLLVIVLPFIDFREGIILSKVVNFLKVIDNLKLNTH